MSQLVNMTILSVLPSLFAIAAAIWSKRILPSLLLGLLIGGYLLNPQVLGGFETSVDSVVQTLTDKENLQVILFLYLFSGLITLVRKAGGIQAFSALVEKFIKSERGVFFTLWALLPITFIDCGFRVVGAGAIIRDLVKTHGIAKERIAFTLNNTASPFIELIPFATTYVGFNIANIGLGLKSAGLNANPYQVWIHAIPFEFFSLIVLGLTFTTIFYSYSRVRDLAKKTDQVTNLQSSMAMTMNTDGEDSTLVPRLRNLAIPLICLVALSLYFFWTMGSDPNRAMLIALFISLMMTGLIYGLQKYAIKDMMKDLIAGGNDLMSTIAILVVAWSLGAVSQQLHLAQFVEHQLNATMPFWSIPVFLFLLSSAITYFIGSGWATASLLMPIAISLSVASHSGLSLCIGAVITGGTFGDVTSPVAGMTNMAAHAAGTDQIKYLRYASPYNFAAMFLAASMFLIFGAMHWGA
jgi:tetracycline resistance efflux pump